MKPYRLIGLPYRLGAEPDKHNAGDCLSITRTVIRSYGIKFPDAKREWYRRLKKKDQSVFKEELCKWGIPTTTAKIGTVALCFGKDSYGLAVYWQNGWISFVNQEAKWLSLIHI